MASVARPPGRLLIALYCGDYDPSGLYMSEHDLANRIAKYGGDHVMLKRIALMRHDLDGLPSFRRQTKRKILGMRGSPIITAMSAGNSTQWTRMISALA